MTIELINDPSPEFDPQIEWSVSRAGEDPGAVFAWTGVVHAGDPGGTHQARVQHVAAQHVPSQHVRSQHVPSQRTPSPHIASGLGHVSAFHLTGPADLDAALHGIGATSANGAAVADAVFADDGPDGVVAAHADPSGRGVLIVDRIVLDPTLRGQGLPLPILNDLIMATSPAVVALYPGPINPGPVSSLRYAEARRRLSAHWAGYGFQTLPGRSWVMVASPRLLSLLP